ncbi:MAG: TonB-dependent receptor [Saprospiraceae bacterium]|nr:TonB-dependent receptor [Saprospiraceae bacterium]
MKKALLTSLSLFFCITVLMAQLKVSGTVTDQNGELLFGVNIIEEGTLNGTVTDLEGKYSFQLINPNSKIIFSYIGYTTAMILAEGRTTVDVVLSEGVVIGEVQVVGSRSYNRTATQSPVAIDVIDVSSLVSQNGRVEINQLLQYAAPSFNATKQSGSDGADHIDPASLRGLGPDQTLVLINGKRRHQSSLINLFGTRGRGNTGTDMNAIPVSAIKRIEVLRDGASAQYGSDAIAGVINIVLQDQTDGIQGGISYGMYSTKRGSDFAKQIFDTQDGWEPELFNIDGKNRIDGKETAFDGNTAKVELNYGHKIGDKGGFVNVGGEFLNKDRTLRPSFDWRKGYGSAAASQLQFVLNGALPLGSAAELYFFGTRGDRNTDAYAFTRSAPGPDGDDRAVPSLYPDGFTPRITSKIVDNAITAGVRFDLPGSWKADISQEYGSNNFQYNIKGTNNASMGPRSPTEFDAGGHSLAMYLTSLDLSKYYKNIAAGMNLAFGAEYRREQFNIFAGEVGSYAQYDVNGQPITNPATQTPYENEFGQVPGGGSQGFPGYSPSNEVDEGRGNLGIYGDAELNITKDFLLNGAVRFENYSDFGSTFNYKLASRFNFTEQLGFRASVSSGFRAPSLAQIHYNLIFTNIVAGASLQTLLASNTSSIARSFGIDPLKQETANNLAAGFTFNKAGFTATIDGYLINVKDRIILTDNFDASFLNQGVEIAQFFANGADTRTTGLDIVLNYKKFLGDAYDKSITLGIAGNFNRTEIIKVNNGSLNEYTFFGPFSRAYLEAAAPPYKLVFNGGVNVGKFDALLSYTAFSRVELQDFQWVDSPATTKAEADELYGKATDVYEAMGTLDLSLSYQFSPKIRFTLGSNNLFGAYPTPQFDGWTDQGGFNDSVQMGSDGMYLFARLGFKF